MKKIVSILLVFAAMASLMSVCGFATDAEAISSVNGAFDEITAAFAEFVAPITDDCNSIADKIIFDSGINDFLARVDGFMESVCEAIINLVATIEGLF